ncbi:MAG: ATP-dependent helicase [Desulfuromonadales bacterium]|nr:ATP-dependent helicase [Desulfuromonadales bacterium]
MTWNEGITGTALNIAQVDTDHLRVMAGPGTGKSFAMKRRVARLLEGGTDPNRILAVTFTRTAAADLVKELCGLGEDGCEKIHAGTLHSYCFGVLSRNAALQYLNRIPRPMFKFELDPMLKDVGRLGPFGGKRECERRILAFEAAWARLQSDQPGWPLDPVDQNFHNALISWFQFHKSMLIGEIIPETLRFLRNNPASPELTRFDHVIVDEYQDLNKAEQTLLDLIATNSAMAVVGDEDQSIYSFRHAHPQGIVDYGVAHVGTHDESLEDCRRCPTSVVAIADHLIRHNHLPANRQRLCPFQGNPEGEVHITQWTSLEEEATGLADYVEYLIAERDYSPGDILVLSPRRLIGYGIRNVLLDKGIPVHSFFHEAALDASEAKIALTLLTLLTSNEDCVALRYWLGSGSQTWQANQYSKLRTHCEQSGETPWVALEQVVNGELDLRGINRLLERFRLLLGQITEIQGLTGGDLVDHLLPEGQPWAANLREAALLNLTEATEPEALLDVLKEITSQPEMPESGDFVRVMSLHKSKGLTSKVVLVAGCIHGLIPYIKKDQPAAEQEEKLKEQRRLFYVAITRPKEVLILSSAVRLDRALGHRIGIQLQGRSGAEGPTVTSAFVSELGPAAPLPTAGSTWLRKMLH